ncbi:hypothetical protein [Parafilimonas sp.]|uniref:hypothetical protein n=1 Tax=Parafilimonas sp. TaxID=1969739 RepID=UPI0039E56F03
MKAITSILLLFIMLMQTFSSFVYDAAYSLNKNYIAENFCINKTRPQLHCNGHCYLNKQKAKEQGSNKQANENRPEKVQAPVYEAPGETIAGFNNYIITEIPYNRRTDNTLLQGYSSSIFHPPLA